MNPDKQRIAIAEACGYEWPGLRERRDYIGWTLGGKYIPKLPEYLGDLNAMHEAEKVLTEAQKVEYARHIFCAEQQAHEESDETWHRCVFATAAQRAESFLRTIGAWVDEPKAKQQWEQP